MCATTAVAEEKPAVNGRQQLETVVATAVARFGSTTVSATRRKNPPQLSALYGTKHTVCKLSQIICKPPKNSETSQIITETFIRNPQETHSDRAAYSKRKPERSTKRRPSWSMERPKVVRAPGSVASWRSIASKKGAFLRKKRKVVSRLMFFQEGELSDYKRIQRSILSIFSNSKTHCRFNLWLAQGFMPRAFY